MCLFVQGSAPICSSEFPGETIRPETLSILAGKVDEIYRQASKPQSLRTINALCAELERIERRLLNGKKTLEVEEKAKPVLAKITAAFAIPAIAKIQKNRAVAEIFGATTLGIGKQRVSMPGKPLGTRNNSSFNRKPPGNYKQVPSQK